MANIQIKDFPAVTAPQDGDYLHISRSGLDRKIAVENIFPELDGYGVVIIDTYESGTDFIQDVTNSLELSQYPLAKNNIEVYFDGVYQNLENYSVTNNIVVFNDPIPSPIQTVEIRSPKIVPPSVTNADYNALVTKLNNIGDNQQIAVDAAAASSASASQAEMYRDQASEIAGLDTVAEAVGVINLPQPDVYIPFNDGLRIESGYGTHDQIDVSAAQDGSLMVDLPTRSVDFSRASASTVINKSGELVEVAADEPAISADGLQIFGGSTNYITWSDDVSNSAWGKTLGAGVTPGAITAPNGTDLACAITETTGTDERGVFQVKWSGAAEPHTASAYLKKGLRDEVQISFFSSNQGAQLAFVDINSGVVLSDPDGIVSKIEKAPLGWFRVSFSRELTEANRVKFSASSNQSVTYSGSSGEAFYIWRAQLESGNLATPGIKTEAATVTRSADLVDIPTLNNLPPAGSPLTIMMDCSVPYLGESGLFYIEPALPEAAILCRRNISGAIQFYYDKSDGTDRTVAALEVDENKHRFVARVGANTMALFVDGVKIAERDLEGDYPDIDSQGVIRIGRTFSADSALGSSISNFKIYHTALTDEQIAALGGPN